MNPENRCPHCGKAVSADALRGLCPECLLKAGLPTGETAAGPTLSFEPPSPQELARKFPQLEVTALLGRGGMGAVYKARQKRLDRVVALKILPPEVGQEPSFAARFEREAKALAKLTHPNIVTLYEFGQADGLFYFLMKYVDGVSLGQLLHGGLLAPKEALAIVPQICEALQYAHDQGIVHRDIKPGNILLGKSGQVKIADFGLAKIMGPDALPQPLDHTETTATAASAPRPDGLTEIGKVMGTVNYMAPEQAEQFVEVDHRADIYALGVVFYQMLTGELPGQRLEPPSRKVQIDVRLDEVVLRALESKPELRFQQVSEVKTAVETIVASGRAKEAIPERGVATGATPKAKSALVLMLEAVFGIIFSSPLAIKLVNTSSLGFLSSLAVLGFVPLPGMERCFGFSGFAGFFGLVGVAFVVEFAQRCRATGAAGRPILVTLSTGLKGLRRGPLLVLVLGLVAVFAVILALGISRRAEDRRLMAIRALEDELRAKITELLGSHRMTCSGIGRFYVGPDPRSPIIIFGGWSGWKGATNNAPRPLRGNLSLRFEPPNIWLVSGTDDLEEIQGSLLTALPGSVWWPQSTLSAGPLAARPGPLAVIRERAAQFENRFVRAPGRYSLDAYGSALTIDNLPSGSWSLKATWVSLEGAVTASPDNCLRAEGWFVFIERPGRVWIYDGLDGGTLLTHSNKETVTSALDLTAMPRSCPQKVLDALPRRARGGGRSADRQP